MKKLPSGTKHGKCSFKIAFKIFFRDVFGRADADNSIEGFAGPKFEKIIDLDPALPFQPGGANALARNLRLFRTEREAERAHPVIFRRVQHQRPPTTAHIE